MIFLLLRTRYTLTKMTLQMVVIILRTGKTLYPSVDLLSGYLKMYLVSKAAVLS